MTMTSNLRPDAINPHAYGLNAAQALTDVINQIFISTDRADLSRSLNLIDEIRDPGLRNSAMQALITYAGTGDLEAAAQSIKGYEYIAAHLYLGKQMHALAVKDQMLQSKTQLEHLPILDELPVYPQIQASDQPATTPITVTLYESIQASNAPSAAISAATCLI